MSPSRFAAYTSAQSFPRRAARFFHTVQRFFRPAAAFIAGALLNLAFAPFGLWPLGLAAPAAFFLLLRNVPARGAALIGAGFGAGLFSFGTYWLYTSIHHFGAAPIWLTLLLQAALVAIMAFYSAVLALLANRFWPRDGAVRHWLVLPGLWVLLEWVRGWALSGFPWLSLGYAFIDAPLAGFAPLLGVYGVTWAAAYVAVCIAVLLSPRQAGSQRALALGLAIALCGLPAALRRVDFTVSAGARFPAAIVQGAIPQDEKWLDSNRDATLIRYAHLTAERAWGARLIVWPEAALPVLANDLGDYLGALAAAGRKHAADFAIGLVRYEPQNDSYRNGLLVLSEGGEGWYYKRRLVPFGEFFPVPAFVRSWMRLMSLPYTDMTPGSERQPLLHAAGQPLGVTICYEDAYGSQQLDVLRQATVLINVTNNAWYGDSTAPHQHLQISRMRALEAQRNLIRSANDGISALIDARGQVAARLPQFVPGVLRVQVEPRRGLTPYARAGNYPVLCAASALLALALALRRRRARRLLP